MVQIAYLYLTHRDPKLLRLFAKHCSKGEFFVHVDAKVELEPFRKACLDCDNVSFSSQRVSTYWGDFSYVEAEIELMRLALAHPKRFDRFVIVQGADYPIVSECTIEEYYDSNKDVNFINAAKCQRCGPVEMNKYRMRHDLSHNGFLQKVTRKISLALARQFGFGLWTKPSHILLLNGNTMELFSGWAHFSVTRDVASYFVAFHDKHSEFNQYFKEVYAADESYFHTIFWNSPLKSSSASPVPLSVREGSSLLNNTYFEYPTLVRLFTQASEYPFLASTGKLFFRKVDSFSGAALLDKIEQECAAVSE